MTSDALAARAGKVVWLIEADKNGFFLYQFGPSGFVGDTWHPNVEEAKAQAAYSMGTIVGPWNRVPPEVSDLQAYGIAQAKTSAI